MVEFIALECGLSPGSVIADIGSGTGLLSRAFLDAGFEVVGVEPNRDMREAGDSLLSGSAGFRSVDGTAEATTLPDGSTDLAVAGQAFHWFDVEATRREWKRILHPGCFAALIWNDRLREGAFMSEVESLIDRFSHELDGDGAIRERGESRIAPFFAPAAVKTAEFPNSQQFDFEGLRSRIFSASYLPQEDSPKAAELTYALKEIFDRHQREGQVAFLYRTKIYWARIAA